MNIEERLDRIEQAFRAMLKDRKCMPFEEIAERAHHYLDILDGSEEAESKPEPTLEEWLEGRARDAVRLSDRPVFQAALVELRRRKHREGEAIRDFIERLETCYPIGSTWRIPAIVDHIKDIAAKHGIRLEEE